GPKRATTPKLLDFLRDCGIKATFFITGQNIAGNEDLIRRERDAGHLVANHQFVHKNIENNLPRFIDNVVRERDLLDQVLAPQKHARFVRYPGGDCDPQRQAELPNLEYPDRGIGWSVDSLDWCYAAGKGRCSRREIPPRLHQNYFGWVDFKVREKR